MQIIINGEQRYIPEELTVEGLIRHLSLSAERIAVERNREVVRRATWSDTYLVEGDTIEVIYFVGGGIDNEVLKDNSFLNDHHMSR